jgi:hypothetical protein
MSAPGVLYRIREWLTSIAFAIYLLCAGMTKEEFWAEQDRQALQQVLEANGVGEWVEAIKAIKGLVAGDARPHWDVSMETTQSRMKIADICDAMLQALHDGEAVPPSKSQTF